MSYTMKVYTDDYSTDVYIDFHCLSDEFTIVKICRFQCIGWMLKAVSQAEYEVAHGATWMNPEASVQALMKFAELPEYLARKLIESDSIEEQFNFAWSHISDKEKTFALTTNFAHYDNFWPYFECYATAFRAHIANTQQLDDLKEESKKLEYQLTRSLNNQTLAPNTPMEISIPTIPIDYIESTRTENRQVKYKSTPPPSYDTPSNQSVDH